MKKNIYSLLNINFLTLLLLLILILVLFLSGNINYYVHPKMYIPIGFGSIVIFLLLFAFLYEKTRPETMSPKQLVLFFPVLFALLYAPNSLEERMSKIRGSNFSINSSVEENRWPGGAKALLDLKPTIL